MPTEESYSGPTWDYAGIRQHYRATYNNREWAETLAVWLTKANSVGFTVAEADVTKGGCG